MIKITVTVKRELDGSSIEKTISKEFDPVDTTRERINMEIQNLFMQIEKSNK
jgi:hypothetical protein